ncbi:lytic polysaccharide monooxygenase [Sporormia fimetaria CBS 119925]|uniref:lytic cellulose monooxygenase (C4-dehydrogenating) n=1 Tax=Sporormia fimetaria CBS 119925 TaxID=1340428 RepID=A0A6A6VEW0_9PLEO|nr:lytic polysaccharide monooxygenase [Sporormia fimetaria CBS 119925]
MKGLIPLLTLAFTTPSCAHYIFGRLILNNKWTDTFEYVREVSPAGLMLPPISLLAPNTDPTSRDLRCGRNATLAHPGIKTAAVRAGEKIGFGAGEPSLSDTESTMYHPGFASVWMSKVPGDQEIGKYEGEEGWFKILVVKGREGQSVELKGGEDGFKSVWGTWNVGSWNFTIPDRTPPGKYLLRFEHIFPNREDAQFYVNCAHVEIINDRDDFGTPGPLVKIPGVYTRGQKDVYFSTYDFDFDIAKFVPPAPVVWRG